MITTDTLTTLQRLGVRFLVTPTFTPDGPALDITMEHGQGSATARWVGRAMAPELVDKCINRGLPTLKQRMEMFRKTPEHTQR